MVSTASSLRIKVSVVTVQYIGMVDMPFSMTDYIVVIHTVLLF